MSTIAPAPDDELVLGWWEEYDAGRSAQAIARRAGVRQAIVFDALDELGVFEDPIVHRARHGQLDANELAIVDALAKINSHDLTPERREVRYARSMEHVKPVTGPVVQSARQRRQDRMASAKWRSILRRDLRAAGLLP